MTRTTETEVPSVTTTEEAPVPYRQPLNRRTVTEGSIMVLPAYPIVFYWSGLFLLFQGASRTSSPAFDAAKWVFPIHTWAVVFLTIAAFETWALLTHRRVAFKYLLVAGCSVTCFWLGLILCSAFASSVVSFAGVGWIGGWAWAHIASIRSLTRDVVIKDPDIVVGRRR